MPAETSHNHWSFGRSGVSTQSAAFRDLSHRFADPRQLSADSGEPSQSESVGRRPRTSRAARNKRALDGIARRQSRTEDSDPPSEVLAHHRRLRILFRYRSNSLEPREFAKLAATAGIDVSAVIAELEPGVDSRRDVVVCSRWLFPEMGGEPGFNLKPSPEPVTVPWVGDRGREPSGTTFASDQQPDALSGPVGAGSDVSHRHESGIGNPDHFDTIEVLDVGDRRQDGFLQAGSVSATPGLRRRKCVDRVHAKDPRG